MCMWKQKMLCFSKNVTKCVATLALGSQPKQGLARMWAKREAWESHFMFPRVQKSVREWTLTLPKELPLWELESLWTPEDSKSNYRGQNVMDWKVPYIIANLLKLKCLKWAHMAHLDTSNTSYGQKKGRESNWQFDSRTLKVGNHPNFLAFRWRATYCWKVLNEGYNFALHLISIKGLHAKLWAPKVAEVLGVGISGLPLGSAGTKCHLGVGPIAKHRVYYKGEGGGFPPSPGRGEFCESEFARGSS